WAADWPERTWAVEGARGLGYLLAQQLVAAGERVLDIQPKLGARVRLLATGASGKNDPNDARSVDDGSRGGCRRPCGGAEGMVQAAPGSGPGAEPARLPAPRRAV